jgi:hypothetical protein
MEYLLKICVKDKNRFLKILKEYCGIEVSNLDNETIQYIVDNIKKTSLYKSIKGFHDIPSHILQNKMSTKYRDTKTLNGYSFDVAKSALQKYIRRGCIEKSLYLAAEMDMFRWAGAKSQLTNFYNRIRVITLEDVGLANPHVLIEVDALLKAWINKTDIKPSLELLNCVKLLTMSPHCRYYSHLRYYMKEKVCEDDKEDIQKKIKDCIINKDVKVFCYVQKILDMEKLDVKINKSNRPGFLIFDIVKKLKLKTKNQKLFDDSLAICEEWYKTLKVKENFLCCIHPIYLYIMETNEDIFFNVMDTSLIKYYDKVLSNKTIKIDSFVYDMHTRKGRNMGKNITDFVTEGAMVAYEKVFNKKYAEFYLKKGTVISKESSQFTLKCRAQLICSNSRPDTYFAKSEQSNVVVKGPFLDLESAMISFKIQSIFRLFRGVNYVNSNIRFLIPDLLETPLGCRTKIEKGKGYYFVVTDDLFDKNTYPVTVKSSKMWSNTEVLDYEKLFKENKEIGFGKASEMSKKALFSFLLQLTIRYIFGIGDFATRNFIRIKDKVYNLDTEGIDIGYTIKFSKSEKDILKRSYQENEIKYKEYIKEWYNDEYSWFLVSVVFDKKISEKARNLLKDLNSFWN